MNKLADSSINKDGLLAKNTLINILGRVIPLIFAAAAIPFVIDGLGIARFGILTIVWIIIGYFGLFDMGIGRATTKLVADLEAKGQEKLAPYILSSILLLLTFGVVGSLIIYIATPWIVYQILNIPANLIAETEQAFYIISTSIPFVLGAVGARGALEAQQQFATINAIKIPASIINYMAPLLVLPFSNSLVPIVTVLVIARVITFFVYCYLTFRDSFTFSFSDFRVAGWIKDLLSFGSWVMVSNIISPLLVYIDRFVLGAALTMAAVAYYTTPFELVTRLLIVSSSFMGVMFPAFSVYSLNDKKHLGRLHRQSIRYVLLVMMPLVVFILLAAQPLLYLWLGSEFAVNSSAVLQLLALGVLVNAVAYVPFTALQAIGRPDITAKLHMVELPLYLAMLWYLTITFGIRGVALAWVLRVSLDCALLLYFSNRFISFFKTTWSELFQKSTISGAVIIAVAGVFYLLNNIYTTLLLAFIFACIALFIAWQYVLKADERDKIKVLFSNLRAGLN